MNRKFCHILFALILVSCGAPTGRFRVEGRFRNLNQGEFYIYSLERGTKDTIAVRDGRFVYDTPLRDSATLMLVFPNFSELPVFATPDKKIKIEGDVSHLKETTVRGSTDNDAMTAFRMATNETTPAQAAKEARRFILEHRRSPVSLYLLRRHFIQTAQPDYRSAYALCDSLLTAQPSNVQLVRLHRQLKSLRRQRTTGQLPPFKATATDGTTVSNATLKGQANVVFVWSSWSHDSRNPMRILRRLQKEHPHRLSVIGIELDASPSEGRHFMETDSIKWPNVCDGLLWQSPILAQLGIGAVPTNIVTDGKGKIIGRNLNGEQLRKTVGQLLDE